MNSVLFWLNKNDLAKGLLMAVYGSIVGTVYQLISVGTVFDLAAAKAIGIAALLSALSYLMKNVFTNSAGEPLKPEPKQFSN